MDHPVSTPARTLSQDELASWRRWAHRTEQKIIAAISKTKEGFWEMAEQVYEFEHDVGWKALGYDTLNEWLAQPEIGVKRRQYFRMAKMWKELVVLRKVPTSALLPLDYTKVDVVLPRIADGTVTLQEGLDDVEALGVRDLRDKYYGEQEEGTEDQDRAGDATGAPQGLSDPPEGNPTGSDGDGLRTPEDAPEGWGEENVIDQIEALLADAAHAADRSEGVAFLRDCWAEVDDGERTHIERAVYDRRASGVS
jgi:hypothetical protein